jgi:non-homologous end joining protein Ku
MLRVKFFLEFREINLINIDSVYYLKPIETPNEVLEEEILEALR